MSGNNEEMNSLFVPCGQLGSQHIVSKFRKSDVVDVISVSCYFLKAVASNAF